MFEFAYPWLFLLLPLPLLVRWLVPAYQESQDSIRVPFFQRLVENRPQSNPSLLESQLNDFLISRLRVAGITQTDT